MQKKGYHRKVWTTEEVEQMFAFYPITPTKTIADALNRSVISVYHEAAILGIRKSKEYLSSELSGTIIKGDPRGVGVSGRFKKGMVPATKGKKWAEFMSSEGQKNSLKTTFQTGHLPHNTKANGVISVRREKFGRLYKWIRVAQAKWVMLHVYNWEKQYGKVPLGMIVVFKSGTDNCNIENLELITRRENLDRNRLTRYPLELQETIKTLNKLKKQVYGKKQNTRPA